nr:hypothetical protein [Actinocrispum wychmicini]
MGWFHGREKLTQALADLVTRQYPGGGPVMVVGSSGAGKSSLLRAGLIPILSQGETGSRAWKLVLCTPGAHPMAEWERRLDTTGDHLLIVVDQFEELFTLCTDHDERTAFIKSLVAVARRTTPAASVVLGMRADFYAHASGYPDLVEALQNAQIVVGPMDRTELRRAIVEPARSANLDVDGGLVELLLRELEPGQPGSGAQAYEAGTLPLLSHALHMTWKRARGGVLTIEDYTATGGIRDAIAATAETVFTDLNESQRDIARRLFLRLVHLGDQTTDTRRRVSHPEILPEGRNNEGIAVGEVLDLFVDQRLITTDTNSVYLAHEALLTAWPRLRGWIEADRAGLRTHGRLARDAHAWQDSGRDPSGLYRGSRLAVAQEWTSELEHRADLNTLEREFLDSAANQEHAEQRARRRRISVLRRLIVVLAILVVIASVLTVVVFRQRSDALAERDMAISRQLATAANQLWDHDVSLAMQLALAAYRISPTLEARSALLDATATTPATRILGSEGASQSVAFTPNGQILAAANADHTIRLWRLDGHSHVTPLGTPIAAASSTIFTVTFDRTGTLLAVGGGDKTVRLWNVTHPDHPTLTGTPLTDATNTIYSVTFSPNGHTLAAASADKTIHLWDVTDPNRPVVLPVLTGFTDFAYSVAFSQDGHTLAAGSADGTVRLWDISNPTQPSPAGPVLTGPTRKVFTVAFTPDGNTLAAGSADKNIYLWDVTHRDAPITLGMPLTGATSWINTLAFSQDGRTLAAGSSDNTVRLWNLTSRTVERVLPHPGPVTAIAFADNMLATTDADGTIRIWDLPGSVATDSADTVLNTQFTPNGQVLVTGSGLTDGKFRLWDVTQRPRLLGQPNASPVPANRFNGMTALSGDGRTLATGSINGRVQLWDIQNPQHPVPIGEPLTGPTAASASLAFSSDGHLLAASGEENIVWLWDVTDKAHPRPLHPLTGPSNYVPSVAFSPDGHTLAAGSVDKNVWLWDVTNPDEPTHLATLSGPTNYVSSVAFSHNGHTLAVGSADKKVRLWDVTNNAHPEPLGQPLTGPGNYVYSVAFSAEDHILAAASADKTIWLWDTTNQRRPGLFATLNASAGPVHSATFSPNSRIIAAGGTDRTVRLWAIDPQLASEYICSAAGDPITLAEWTQYVHDLPYRPIC